MSDLRPRVIRHPSVPDQDLVNPSAVVEMARASDTPQSKAFLKAFHAIEADVARESPFLSEGSIRQKAVIRALESLGHRVVLTKG